MSEYSEPVQDCQWSDRNDVSPDRSFDAWQAEMGAKQKGKPPWQLKLTGPRINQRNQWEVFHGHAILGAFWMDETAAHVYVGDRQVTQEREFQDIGWLGPDPMTVAQWVYDRYHQIKKGQS